ncbi:MAG: rhodanese-like domain-containing protein [Halanaeroarchaeum sp.]
MVAEIEPAELAALRDAGTDLRIVDVRAGPAFDRGHIPGSEHLPLHSIADGVADLVGAETVVAVCPHGEASRQAVKLIQSYEGIDADTRVVSLAGGLEAWDGPLVASEEEEETA